MQILNKLLCWFSIGLLAFAAPMAEAGEISGKINLLSREGLPVSDASNLVVFIDNLKLNPDKKNHFKVASKYKDFLPKVLPILVGTTVDFPNEDDILHNVFSLSKISSFDLGLYKKGIQKSIKFDKPGLAKLYCNIHEKMVGYILVLENPFFTTTNEAGDFRLQGLPDGTYTLRVWHRFADVVSGSVSIHNKEVKWNAKTLREHEPLMIRIQEGEREEAHLNKWGEAYKSKY